MPVSIITNNQPREILSWIPESAQKEHDYINWEAIENGSDSCSFVCYKGTYWNINETEGGFPHGNDWYYISMTYGFGYLFKLVDVENEMMVICGTYIIKGD